MKHSTLLILLSLCWCLRASAQANTGELATKLRHVSSINMSNYRKDDFAFIDSIAKEKRIIFLGEENHYDGSTISAKARLISYLLERHNFEVLVLEDEFYEMYRANEFLRDRDIKQWATYSELFRNGNLISTGIKNDLIPSIINTRKKITLLGLDLIYSSAAFHWLLKEDLIFHGVSRKSAERYWELIAEINSTPFDKISDLTGRHFEFDDFMARSKSIIDILEKQTDARQADNVAFLVQTIQSKIGLAEWVKTIMTEGNQGAAASNVNEFFRLRDKQMGVNLNWILEKFPNKKVIVSTSTYHVSKGMYKQPVMIDHLPGNVQHDSFVIPFVSYKGQRGFQMKLTKELSDYEREVNSVEYFLHTLGAPYAFLNTNDLNRDQRTFLNSLTMFPSGDFMNRSNWTEHYDGLFFIDQMEADSFDGISSDDMDYMKKVLYKKIDSKK